MWCLDSVSIVQTNCTVVTLVAMVCVCGYYGNSRVTFLWLCDCWYQFLWGSYEFWHGVEEVFRSIFPLPRQFLPLSISIFHHVTSHVLFSHTFNFSHHPITPSFSHPHLSASVCFPASPFFSPYLLTSPSSFIFSPAMPSISPSPCCASLSVPASSSLFLPLSMSPLLAQACSPIIWIVVL